MNDRVIYECIKPISQNNYTDYEMRIATQNDYEVVLKMCLEYYQEDFNGKGQQSEGELTMSAKSGIMESSIFILKVDRKPVSIARIINSEKKNVMIGGIYTNIEDRCKGYGAAIIAKMTQRILESGAEKCGLLTESKNIGSNRICEKVGYKKVYEWMNILIK